MNQTWNQSRKKKNTTKSKKKNQQKKVVIAKQPSLSHSSCRHTIFLLSISNYLAGHQLLDCVSR